MPRAKLEVPSRPSFRDQGKAFPTSKMIEDFIDRWQLNASDERDLIVALGMTKSQYTRWMADPTTLGDIMKKADA